MNTSPSVYKDGKQYIIELTRGFQSGSTWTETTVLTVREAETIHRRLGQLLRRSKADRQKPRKKL